MGKNITLVLKEDLGHTNFEIVERKGQGHPDTLSDTLAEKLSNAYSKYTLKHFGAVLHHNFDKVGMMGGKCEVEFGHGKMIEPIRVLLNGRASSKFGNTIINVKELLINETKKFFNDNFPMLNFEKDVRIIYEVSEGSSPGGVKGHESKRHRWFEPETLDDLNELKHLNCNDTSMGCAFYGYSILENIVYKLERKLNSKEFKKNHIWLGSDIKIMGFREDNKVSITMCIPQLCTYVRNVTEYLNNKAQIAEYIKTFIHSLYPNVQLELYINTRDKIDENNTDLYLTFTGSSIEMGDEGFVGRGNRMGGLITPRRFYTMEGICGKNPIYHTGKMYCVASYIIAKKIYEKCGVNCSVEMIGQSGQPLSDPFKITIYTDKKIDYDVCDQIASNVLNDFSKISMEILDEKYPMC